MKREPVIIITEDDNGHLGLILNSLKAAGIRSKTLHFNNGEQTLNFLLSRGDGPSREYGVKYILLLDIRLPGIDGIEVLRQLKGDKSVSDIPVIMISSTDYTEKIDECKNLECDSYFVKSAKYSEYSQTIKQLGHYIKTVIFPVINNKCIRVNLEITDKCNPAL